MRLARIGTLVRACRRHGGRGRLRPRCGADQLVTAAWHRRPSRGRSCPSGPVVAPTIVLARDGLGIAAFGDEADDTDCRRHRRAR